jgi:hypothetical protein
MNWHADRDTLDGYAEGRIGDADAFSLEAHLLACARCRLTLAGTLGRERLDRIWVEVVDQVDRPPVGRLESLLGRLGAADHIVRLLMTTPLVRTSWVLLVASVLGIIALAAHEGGGGTLPFLVLAPIVPVVGIASAYGRTIDPLDEIGLASPAGGFRLFLIRMAAILLASMVLVSIAVVAMPGMGWTSFAWLVPSFALTVLTMALSSKLSPHAAAVTVIITWGLSVALVVRLSAEPAAAFGLEAQFVFGAIAAAAALLVFARRESFETRRVA